MNKYEAVNTGIGDWLPLVAKTYDISENLNDYIIMPVTILISDIPNRNGMAFPAEELTRFIRSQQTSDGEVLVNQISYKSWEKCPVFSEHKSDNDSKAKGVVFDVFLEVMPCKGIKLYKVVALLGIDKTKDTYLANKLEKGEINTFSLGSYFSDAECSICGKLLNSNLDNNGNYIGCNHVKYSENNLEPWKPEVFDVNGKKELAYWKIVNSIGQEISVVADPAYFCAQSEVGLTEI